VASRFRCRSCERGCIFPRAPEQFVTSPLCLVGYVRWDARSDRVPPLPSSQARLLAPSPLRTVRNTFALHGSSTQQRPLYERGRSLIQVQLRPTRYWVTADSHGDGKFTRRVGSRTNGLRRRHCFASCIGSINGLECEHRRKVCSVSGDVMLSRTGDATSICAITAQHSLPFALPYPHRHCPPHGVLPHVCGERYGFTLFRWNDVPR
jgi:hypothetical protein